jgi:hypothetical protein
LGVKYKGGVYHYVIDLKSLWNPHLLGAVTVIPTILWWNILIIALHKMGWRDEVPQTWTLMNKRTQLILVCENRVLKQSAQDGNNVEMKLTKFENVSVWAL